MAQFSFGQTLDSIQGLWRFEAAYHAAGESFDSADDARLGQMFESMAYEFKANGVVILSMFDKDEKGTYVFLADKKIIEVTAGKRTVELEILAFEGNRMAVKLSAMQFWVKLE